MTAPGPLVSRAVLVALLLAAAAPLAASLGPGGSAALPPPECVRLLRQARIAEGKGELDEAMALLARAAEAFPQEVLPLEALLRLHEERGLAAEVAAELRERLVARLLDPSTPLPAGTASFLVESLEGQPALLGALATRLERRSADDPDRKLLEVLAVAQGKLGLELEARRTLGRLIELEPSYAAVAMALKIDLEHERWHEALALLEPLLDHPQHGEAWHSVHLELLARTGQTERVRAQLERLDRQGKQAVLSSDGHRSLLKEVAWNLYDAGETEMAELLWRRLLAEDAEDLEAQRVVAHLFGSEEERRAGAEQVDRQLAGDLEPAVLLDEGTSYLAAGDAARAYDLLARAAPGLGDDEAAWFNLGLAAKQLERWAEAAEAFARAVALNEARPETHAHLGTVLRELGRCGEAVAHMRRALQLDPDRTATWYYLAKCYEALGETGRAAEAMAEYRGRAGE